MLRKGDKVPDFALPMATPEGRRTFRMSDALGKGDVVLAFYPLAFTSTCTEQLCETRDSMAFFAHVGAAVYGFSIDTPHSNAAYGKAQNLQFPLISDPNREVVDSIWETQTVAGVARCAKRGVVVIGGDGVVKHVWVTDDADEWPGLDEVKAVLHAHHRH